jgi:hypothetical protein
MLDTKRARKLAAKRRLRRHDLGPPPITRPLSDEEVSVLGRLRDRRVIKSNGRKGTAQWLSVHTIW